MEKLHNINEIKNADIILRKTCKKVLDKLKLEYKIVNTQYSVQIIGGQPYDYFMVWIINDKYCHTFSVMIDTILSWRIEKEMKKKIKEERRRFKW